MVKKLIGGLLGKKEGKDSPKEQKNGEDVPDELPPLVEETLANQPPKEEPKEKPQDRPPEGSQEKKQEVPKEEPEDDEILKDFEAYKKEFKETEDKKEVPKEEIAPNSEKKELDKKNIGPKKPEEPTLTSEEPYGFFSELLSITKKQGINESVLKQDLSKRMKEYWYFHPQKKERTKGKDQLQTDLIAEIEKLKRLEERWLAQKRFIEEDKRILAEKEREIKTKTEGLKKILTQISFYNDVPENKHFWLNNGMVAKNIHELISLLEVIDNNTFNHHVNEKGNDFSFWIGNVVGNHDLAAKVAGSRTKEEMMVILENASMGDVYEIEPEKFFRMKDGKVLKDLKELLFALRDCSHDTFNAHKNHKGNDFSDWIRHAFRNDYLAGRIQIAKTKEEAVAVLEDFFG
jgi:hypothetical protein